MFRQPPSFVIMSPETGAQRMLVPCACDREGAGSVAPAICGPKEVLSREEEIILTSLRRMRGEVRRLRTELRECEGDDGMDPHKRYLEALLSFLRKQGDHARAALQDANWRKHRRLGHLELAGE